MTYSKEEILDALMVIVRTCEEQTNCYNCPFADAEDNASCKIMDTPPDGWYLTERKPEIWRAFK